MRKLLSVAAALAAISTFSSPAQAAQIIQISGASGIFGNDDVTCVGATPCNFEETYNFLSPLGYELVSATITSVAQDSLTNIDFTSVTLNGVFFDLLITGQAEFGSLLNQALIEGGNNVIVVRGTSGGDGAYSGTLAFSVSAIPEPASWAMMLLGFGAAGYALRRRRSEFLPQIA